jgi:hypothetical protein
MSSKLTIKTLVIALAILLVTPGVIFAADVHKKLTPNLDRELRQVKAWRKQHQGPVQGLWGADRWADPASLFRPGERMGPRYQYYFVHGERKDCSFIG